MKKEDLQLLIEPLLPKLSRFSLALVKDESLAQQVLVDSLSVYLIREVQDLAEYTLEESKQRSYLKKDIYLGLLREVYRLSAQRFKTRRNIINKTENEFTRYDHLTSMEKGVVFLKHVLEMNVKELQEVFQIEGHHFIELLGNSHQKFLKEYKNELLDNFEIDPKASLVSAYVNETLPEQDREKVEELLGTHHSLYEYYLAKLDQKDYILQQIPDYKVSDTLLLVAMEELKRSLEESFPKDKLHLVKKVAKFLDTPFL